MKTTQSTVNKEYQVCHPDKNCHLAFDVMNFMPDALLKCALTFKGKKAHESCSSVGFT
jgi:hypothetical protein